MDFHKLYEKSGEIASPPAGGSQNPYSYYALLNFLYIKILTQND